MANTSRLEQIEHEIEAVRRDAGNTIAAIEERLRPRRLVEDGVAALRETVPLRELRGSMSDGAVPMLLIAAGLGLWAYRMTRHHEAGPITTAEMDERRQAPTVTELGTDIVLPDESVREHHVHVADSRVGAVPSAAPSPERLLDLERSGKSAARSARAFRQ